jgi:hypothetical protein
MPEEAPVITAIFLRHLEKDLSAICFFARVSSNPGNFTQGLILYEPFYRVAQRLAQRARVVPKLEHSFGVADERIGSYRSQGL